jgi:hypothetical protein
MNPLHHLLKFLLPIFFLLSASGEVPTYDEQWLNLYRYQDGTSLVTNKDWFFHKNGRSSPDEEFKQSISTLRDSPQSRCKYPARTLYLQRKGFLSKELKDTCPKFEYFKRKVKLEKVWLVFASYFVNNPGSAFGHTLFKLQGKGNDNDLLEWGVNFAAEMTTQNPVLYALFGLTGVFQGNFSLLPYFIKISEYSDSETRDLWEYQIDLSEEEKELFLAHLWEMDGATFDYYYLTQNCSYHLLYFLDAIRPQFKFKERMSYFVLPSHTLTVANETPGLIRQTKVRPSQFKKTQARYQNLNENNKELAFLPYKSDSSLSQREQADLLDFKIDYMDLTKGKLLLMKDTQTVAEKRALQAERAQLGELPPSPLKIATEKGPHTIHPSRFLGLGYEQQSFERPGTDPLYKRLLLTYRFSFHEYLDPQEGAPSWSQLMLGKVEGAYDKDRERFELKKFTLFTTEANQENIKNTAAISWGLQMGLRNHPHTQAYDLGPYFETLVGLNWRASWGLFRIIAPVAIDYSRPESQGKDLKYSGKLLGEVMGEITKNFRLIAAAGPFWANYHPEILNNQSSTLLYANLQAQWDIYGDYSLRLKSTLLDKDLQNMAKLLFYF